jgi:hypothetical protein
MASADILHGPVEHSLFQPPSCRTDGIIQGREGKNKLTILRMAADGAETSVVAYPCVYPMCGLVNPYGFVLSPRAELHGANELNPWVTVDVG